MMLNNLRTRIIGFIESKQEVPVIAAISAGLYPFIRSFDSNFILVNSWYYLFFFTLVFLLIPPILCYIIHRLIKESTILKSYHKYVLPILNFCFFGLFMVLSTYGMKKKIMAVVLVLMFCLAMVLYKHLKKIIVIQFLLAIMAFALFVPKVYVYLQQTHEWIELPDSIESSVFKKHPNVYFIQPDGYANFSELKKGYYKFDNALFETYLSDKKFTFYNGFRSNYTSTIFTNSAIFSMKHHYYRYPKDIDINSYDFRNIIVGNNPVLSIFKANDYKTHLLLQQPYFLLNRPKMGYDYCNIDYNDIPYFSHGFDMNLDVNSELEMLINQNSKSHNFYVLEKILPSHIAHSDGDSNGIEEERELYLNRLKEANEWLTNTIEIITSNDPDGLIVICADHGGFVGLKCMDNSSVKTDDRDILHSVFTSVLAIKWPDNHTPDYTDELKTSVNLFRVLVSYLSENETYLNYLEDDKSFSIIDTGAPLGVYEVLDEAGHTAFNRSVE